MLHLRHISPDVWSSGRESGVIASRTLFGRERERESEQARRNGVMGKRENETKEERRERKRQKKEKKKHKQKQQQETNREETPTTDQPSASVEEVDTAISETASTDDIFFRRKLELTVSLLPAALADIPSNIDASLRELLLRYSDAVSGIVLAFENVQILSKQGMILNELPHIHYQVSLDALIFHPTLGCRLTGSVTESFHSHVSLLVFDYFNASVSAPQMVKHGFVFDESTLAWYKGETTLAKGDKLNCTIEKMYESNGIISIEGVKPTLS